MSALCLSWQWAPHSPVWLSSKCLFNIMVTQHQRNKRPTAREVTFIQNWPKFLVITHHVGFSSHSNPWAYFGADRTLRFRAWVTVTDKHYKAKNLLVYSFQNSFRRFIMILISDDDKFVYLFFKSWYIIPIFLAKNHRLVSIYTPHIAKRTKK